MAREYEVTRQRVDLTPEQVDAILAELKFDGLGKWSWETMWMDGWNEQFGIRVGIRTHDRDAHTARWQYGRTWWIEPVHDEADVIRTVFLGVLTLFEHEARELITYKGRRLFEAHAPADKPFKDV